MVTKKTPIAKKVVKKVPGNLAVKKKPVTQPRVKTKSPATNVTKVVRAAPRTKIVDKGISRSQAPKAGVHPLKKVQTAEGWKRANEKQHLAKKNSEGVKKPT